jgi:hypothetical protein
MAGLHWGKRLGSPRHAAEKLETYGIEGERLTSWWAALTAGESFVDVTTGTRALVIDWEGRPVDLSSI